MTDQPLVPAVIHHLRDEAPVVLPSMLLCDFSRLADEIARLEKAGARGFHLDVMDGHFVPNFTYGMTIVEAFRQCTTLPLDVHLMVANPHKYVEQFRNAGADLLTIHIEAVEDPRPTLESIRSRGAAAGLAINPPTPVETILRLLSYCDLVLVMSVMPGFGGQRFDARALDKLKRLRREIGDSMILLEVDGGIQQETIGPCAEAGADVFVVGSAIFRQPEYNTPIRELTQLAREQRAN